MFFFMSDVVFGVLREKLSVEVLRRSQGRIAHALCRRMKHTRQNRKIGAVWAYAMRQAMLKLVGWMYFAAVAKMPELAQSCYFAAALRLVTFQGFFTASCAAAWQVSTMRLSIAAGAYVFLVTFLPVMTSNHTQAAVYLP